MTLEEEQNLTKKEAWHGIKLICGYFWINKKRIIYHAYRLIAKKNLKIGDLVALDNEDEQDFLKITQKTICEKTRYGLIMSDRLEGEKFDYKSIKNVKIPAYKSYFYYQKN